MKRIIKLKYKLPNTSRKLRKQFYTSYNKLLFKLLNIKYGKNINVFNRIYLEINPLSEITIGNNFTFSSGEAFNPLSRNIRGSIYTSKNSKIIIGDNVGISSACLWSHKSITIGNNVKIGSNCILMDTDAHNLNHVIRNSNQYNDENEAIDSITAKNSPIIIEDDVLIGTGCIILKGVTIGARSIIGAGSVVTKSIPADCIAGGNPCKIIKQN